MQRERDTLHCQLDLAHAHTELNVNDKEELQDEEQECDPAVAEFMPQHLQIIQTEAGNATIGSGESYGDGDDNDAGS